MTYDIQPIVSTNNQKGRTHNERHQTQDGFSRLLGHNMQMAVRNISKEHPHRNSDVVQLHKDLDFSLHNLAGQVMYVNFEIHRSLPSLNEADNSHE